MVALLAGAALVFDERRRRSEEEGEDDADADDAGRGGAVRGPAAADAALRRARGAQRLLFVWLFGGREGGSARG